jgi:hypothetical protein
VCDSVKITHNSNDRGFLGTGGRKENVIDGSNDSKM